MDRFVFFLYWQLFMRKRTSMNELMAWNSIIYMSIASSFSDQRSKQLIYCFENRTVCRLEVRRQIRQEIVLLCQVDFLGTISLVYGASYITVVRLTSHESIQFIMLIFRHNWVFDMWLLRRNSVDRRSSSMQFNSRFSGSWKGLRMNIGNYLDSVEIVVTGNFLCLIINVLWNFVCFD